jgi:tetratricopeptide (TPR) repeat protein
MRTIISFLFLIFLTQFFAIGQNVSEQSKSLNFEKARLKTEDLNSFFFKNMKYPQNAFQDDPVVNVLLSFIIDKDGNIDSIKVLHQPVYLFTLQVLSALDKSKGLWIPSKVNGKHIDKKYIANFKFSTSTVPSDFKEKGLKYYKKGDIEKALKNIDIAIKYNSYDKELYEVRSKIYMNLNKIDQANRDIEKFDSINNYLLIDVGFGYIRNRM